MNFEGAFYAALVFILIREIVYQATLHRMVNKLMSRDFWEYQRSLKLPETPKKDAVSRADLEPEEDLAHILA